MQNKILQHHYDNLGLSRYKNSDLYEILQYKSKSINKKNL